MIKTGLFYAGGLSGRLERSGTPAPADWIRERPVCEHTTCLQAGLQQRAYARHRHDTYTVALTGFGVQEFDYRGSVHRSLPGQVVVLHPDEPHDGRAGTPGGFAYCALNIDPAGLSALVGGLPFVANPVVDDLMLAQTVASAARFAHAPGFGAESLEPLAADELMQTIAQRLQAAASQPPGGSRHRPLGETALRRTRDYLAAHCTQVVSVQDLEAIAGARRDSLGASFKRRFGTSPYRYLLMRRIAYVRTRLPDADSLVALALAAGFADQAHMTRVFKSVIGITPDRYAQMWRAGSDANHSQPRH